MVFKTTTGGEVKVEFWHEQELKTIRVWHEDGRTWSERPIRGETNCMLVINDRNYLATAHCSVMDQFDKAKGRVLAFTRALQTAGLDRVDRTALWTQYWKMVNPSLMQQPF